MAWVDDRIYAHPKVLRVSKPARWIFVASIAYSSGWGTRGFLEPSALEAIGCESKIRAELVKAGLWDADGAGYMIHDWDEHNSSRDDRRERDRARKREARRSGRWKEADRDADGARTSVGRGADILADGARPNGRTDRAPARGEGSEGSDGSDRARSERFSSTSPQGLSVARPPTQQASGESIKDIIDQAFAEGGAR